MSKENNSSKQKIDRKKLASIFLITFFVSFSIIYILNSDNKNTLNNFEEKDMVGFAIDKFNEDEIDLNYIENGRCALKINYRCHKDSDCNIFENQTDYCVNEEILIDLGLI